MDGILLAFLEIMEMNLIEDLLQAVHQHPDFSLIEGTWVLLVPEYSKSLTESQISRMADNIVQSQQNGSLWAFWPDSATQENYNQKYIPSFQDQNCIGFLKVGNTKTGQDWQLRPITHPILQMNSMFRHLIIAFKLHILFSNMKLCFSNINDPIAIKNEYNQIEFWVGKTEYRHKGIEDELYNIFLSAISNTALAFDESLNVLNPYIWNENNTGDPFSQGCFIIYQLRNAFAHGIRNPFWVISQKQIERFNEIKINFYLSEDGDLLDTPNESSKNVVFDPQFINHKPFKLGHIGGSGALVCLLKFLFKKSQSLIDNFNNGQ